MSDAGGPVRRRRIAGESGPAAPARKPVVNRATPKKPTVKKPTLKKDVPAKSPAAKKSPTVTTAAPKPPTIKRAATPKAAEPDAPMPKEPRPAGSRPSRRDLLWLVPASLVAAAALVIGVFFVIDPPGQADSGSQLDSSRRQASSAAGSAAETIFSFRYDQLDQHLKASKALMTPSFAKEFDKIAPALTELAPQRSIVVEAVTREAAALPCGDECATDKADVLVFVDQARLIGDSKEPTVFANRIKVSMVKNDGGWLVANIRAL